MYKFYKVHCIYVTKLNYNALQIIPYFMTYSYITIINMHTQALYWSCIELIKDVYLNHDRKVPNILWMIMCTHSINYNYFNLSKVFIKIYNTDISIVTVYLYCFWVLRVAKSSHIDHTCTNGFFLFTIVPFSLRESLTEYFIAPVVWVTITLYCQCHTVAPFYFFQIYIMWFSSCTSNFIKWWSWVPMLIIIHRNVAGLLLLLTNVVS